jgi:hypothetical protein
MRLQKKLRASIATLKFQIDNKTTINLSIDEKNAFLTPQQTVFVINIHHEIENEEDIERCFNDAKQNTTKAYEKFDLIIRK